LQQLLANAPADRTWRRRGLLVLCRSHAAKVSGGVADGNGDESSCPGKGVVAGVGGSGDGEETGSLLAPMVGVEAEEVFRTIVCFL